MLLLTVALLTIFGISISGFTSDHYGSSPQISVPDVQTANKTLLVAFFSTAEEYERRSLIRAIIAYRYDPKQVDVVFAIGQSEIPYHEASIKLEQRAYGDIFEVNMPENMNDGKTLQFMKDLRLRQQNGSVPEYT